MFLARVNIYASTDQARVEVAQNVYYVQAPLSGRVMTSQMKLGQGVRQGDLLVELEADPQKLRVEGEQEHQAALQTQLTTLQQELQSQQRALAAESSDYRLAVDQARASLAEAQESAHMAQEEFKRRSELFHDGLLSQSDLDQYQSDLKKKNIEWQAARTTVARAEREARMHAGERQVQIDQINGDVSKTQGELAASGNTVQQLQDELGWHRIVAAGSGRLDEIVDLKPGSYVHEGDRLATIIPEGHMRIVALFEPRTAIGRVRPGQTGWLRLDGFPWQEYGSVMARVTSVGSEVRDGRVRVELDPLPNSHMPLQHGLPGTLQVQIERVSPASFLFRRVGSYVYQAANNTPVNSAANTP